MWWSSIEKIIPVLLLFLGSSIEHEPSIAQKSIAWPRIQPYSHEFVFSTGSSPAASIVLLETAGRAVYRLECHTFLYQGDPDFDYSGDFECRLTSLYSAEAVSTLLTSDPNQPSDWWSRGRFLVSELRGSCAEYADYGRVRTFRLRGMVLRLELRDIVFASSQDPGKPGLESFRFCVSANADDSAASSLTECPKVRPCREETPGCYSKKYRAARQ